APLSRYDRDVRRKSFVVRVDAGDASTTGDDPVPAVSRGPEQAEGQMGLELLPAEVEILLGARHPIEVHVDDALGRNVLRYAVGGGWSHAWRLLLPSERPRRRKRLHDDEDGGEFR